jgi:hypothetical protein
VRLPRLRTVLLMPLIVFAASYVFFAVKFAVDDDPIAVIDRPLAPHDTIILFGATGTAGDGILKAALADPEIKKIHVITRRMTPRIEEGVLSGKVQATLHMDYLDYASLHEQMEKVRAVFWAIGVSSVGVDEETYGRIHVDFPMAFVSEWIKVSDQPDISFHYISSGDISADSSAMWAREKVRAEESLIGFADETKLRVIAYRPDYIGPTPEEAHIGQDLLYWFFAPLKSAVRARQIGQAMIEVTARGPEFDNGRRLYTRTILRFSDAYERR